MAHAAWPSGRRSPPNGISAAFRPAPPARRPDYARAPRSATPSRAKDTYCPKCGADIARRGNVTRCRCKKSPDHGIPRSSGGTYSKPDARVKFIPAEEIITYARVTKPFGRDIGPARVQKNQCRRSVTPPPSSRKVSVVRSTPLTQKTTTPSKVCSSTPPPSSRQVSLTRSPPLTQKPTTPAKVCSAIPTGSPKVRSPPLNQEPTAPSKTTAKQIPSSTVGSCPSLTRFETGENRQIASLNRPSPIFRKVVLSHPSRASHVTDATAPKNRINTDPTEAFARSCIPGVLHSQVHSSSIPPAGLPKEAVVNPISSGSSVLHCQVQSSAIPPAGLPRGAVMNPISPDSSILCPQVQSNAIPTAGLSKEALMNPIYHGSSVSHSQVQSRAIPSAGSPKKAVIDPKYPSSVHLVTANSRKSSLMSPTSVLGEKSTEVYPDTRSTPSSRHMFSARKCNLASPQQEKTIPPTQRPQSTTPAKYVDMSNDFEAAPSTKRQISNDEPTNKEPSINCNMSSGCPVILHSKLHKKDHQPEACWKGKFEVIGLLKHTCDGLEANFSSDIFIKVYEASKQMPEILKLEALHLSQLWPKRFKREPPCEQDIGLCFASSVKRPNRNFDHLLENISSNIGLRTDVGDRELLIFSSKLLKQDHQKKDGKIYFWGVFQKHLRKKHRSNNGTNNAEITNSSLLNENSHGRPEDIDMNLDWPESRETKGGKCEVGAKLEATSGKEIKTAESNVDSSASPLLDIPDVPPGFREAHYTLRKGEIAESRTGSSPRLPKETKGGKCEINVKLEATRGKEIKTAEPNIVSSANLVLDIPDVPPGFGQAHSVFPRGEIAESCTGSSPRHPKEIKGGKCEISVKLEATSGKEIKTAESNIDSSGSLVLDIPDVPPGFTEAHSMVSRGDIAKSCTGSSPRLPLDTPPGFAPDVPPGFTAAGRGIHTITSAGAETGAVTLVSQKKPLIKFSLNVTRRSQTDVPPGFSELRAVKKEPGKPAVCTSAEKITTGKVDELRNKNDEVKVVDNELSDERDFPKSKLLSDIAGSSTASSHEKTSTSPTPSICTQAGGSALVPVADGHQEMQRREKQKHCRKRGTRESSEPSDVESVKRLKVNGRMALKRCVDVRALNSSQGRRDV